MMERCMPWLGNPADSDKVPGPMRDLGQVPSYLRAAILENGVLQW